MKLGEYYGTGYLNEGPALPGVLRIEQERIDISTSSPKPDPNWTFVDKVGHFHARSGNEYPTLTRESVHKDCDGSCGNTCGGEGFHVTVYRCVLCKKKVKPGQLNGPHHETMPGRYDWSAKLEGVITPELNPLASKFGDQVMLRFDAVRPEPWLFFGPAILGNVTVGGGMADWSRIEISVHAAGPLGDRPALPTAADSSGVASDA